MSEDNKMTVPETTDTTVEDVTEPTNTDFKSTSTYLAMAKQIAELKKADADRLALEEQSRQEAEAKRLEEAGNYEDALKLRQAEIDKLKADHTAELTKRDLKTSLIQLGCTNDMFISGALSGYKEGDIGEYVKGLSEAEENKAFFGQTQQKQVLPVPDSVSVSGQSFTSEQLKQMEGSPDQKVRLQAIEYKRAQYDQGKRP